MRRDRESSWNRVSSLPGLGLEEIICIVLMGFFAMQGSIPGIAPNQAAEMTNSPPTGLMKIVGIGSQIMIDGTICLLIAANIHRLKRFTFGLKWTAPIALLALCSTLWSQDAATTARRSVPFVLATIFGLFFASRFAVDRQLSIICKVMLLAAIASAALALFAPAIGLDASTGHQHDWQGIFTQKNACGRAMVFASAALLARRHIRISQLLCLGVFVFVLIMSGSRGAWLIEAALFACYLIVLLVNRIAPSSRKLLLSILFLCSLAAAVVAWVYFPVLAPLLGRDSTLTGRTAIWQQVWLAIVKHPIAGYGFAAFWQGMKGESYNVILALRFVVFHAHNGFLEIWLELGGIGLLLFAMSYLNGWRKLWPLMRSRRLPEASWMIFVLVLVAVYDVDENSLLAFNGLFWVLYVAALADIEILSAEQKLLLRMNDEWVRGNSRLSVTA